MDQNLIFDLLGENLVYILLTGFIILVIFLGCGLFHNLKSMSLNGLDGCILFSVLALI